MATTFTNFRGGYLMVSGDNTLISTSSAEKKSISQFSLYNSSTTTNVVVTLWLVGSGTGTVETNVLDKITVLPQRSVIVNRLISHVLNPSFSLIGNADTANVIVVNASGVTET